MIDLYLSTDGKHTVHVSADSPEQLNQLAPHAMKLYGAVIKKLRHEGGNGSFADFFGATR